MENVKISVVANDPFLREFMVDTRAYCINREVKSFEDEDAARQYFETGGHAHIVVSDVDMPRMNGLKLLSYLKSHYPNMTLTKASGSKSRVLNNFSSSRIVFSHMI